MNNSFIERLEKYRVKFGAFKSSPGDDFGLFFIPVLTSKNMPLKVLSSGYINQQWYHVSVSLPNRCPTWEEMCLVKNLFYGEDAQVVQYHPPKSEYVNNHPYCLHLWSHMTEEIISPPSHLVGVKNETK